MRAGAALAAALLLLFGAGAARAQGTDSVGTFLEGLADSTDAFFGKHSVDFDTTGLDSSLKVGLLRPWRGVGPFQLAPSPIVRFHRAEGWVLGARLRAAGPFPGVLTLAGSYGFSNHGGRYETGWRVPLLGRAITGRRGRFAPGRIGEGARVDLGVRYARETLPFAPEIVGRDMGGLEDLFFGDDRLSVYERRGVEARLDGWAGDFWLGAGFRRARERAMRLATRFSVFGRRGRVHGVEPADADVYSEALGELGFAHPAWEIAAVAHARDGGAERWRLTAAAGKAWRLPLAWKGTVQALGGAAAARAPRQRRFQIGGPRAVASLPYGSGEGTHLLLGRLDLVHGGDLLRALRLPHPDFLVLQPGLFAHAGAVWDDAAARNLVFVKPPGAVWQGATGVLLREHLGFPEPDSHITLLFAWPVGPRSGRFTVGLYAGVGFDLLGPL